MCSVSLVLLPMFLFLVVSGRRQAAVRDRRIPIRNTTDFDCMCSKKVKK